MLLPCDIFICYTTIIFEGIILNASLSVDLAIFVVQRKHDNFYGKKLLLCMFCCRKYVIDKTN